MTTEMNTNQDRLTDGNSGMIEGSGDWQKEWLRSSSISEVMRAITDGSTLQERRDDLRNLFGDVVPQEDDSRVLEMIERAGEEALRIADEKGYERDPFVAQARSNVIAYIRSALGKPASLNPKENRPVVTGNPGHEIDAAIRRIVGRHGKALAQAIQAHVGADSSLVRDGYHLTLVNQVNRLLPDHLRIRAIGRIRYLLASQVGHPRAA